LTRESQDEGKSRSQVKREYRELKDLGIQLTALTSGQLCAMPLSGGLRDAVQAAKQMPRNARQRQYRYISSLLVEEDVDTIRAALAGELQPHAEEVAAIHEAEGWRDRLLSSDEGELTAFIERFPECDRTHLRQLVRNTKKERDLEKPPRSARQLYQYIRQLVRPM